MVILLFVVKIYEDNSEEKDGNKEYGRLEKVPGALESKTDSKGMIERRVQREYRVLCLIVVNVITCLIKESDQDKEISSYLK